MNYQNVKQVIQELALENFKLYPNNYFENGVKTDDAEDTAKKVAIVYWDTRDENEIERDLSLQINQEDYINWVLQEFNDFVKSETD